MDAFMLEWGEPLAAFVAGFLISYIVGLLIAR